MSTLISSSASWWMAVGVGASHLHIHSHAGEIPCMARVCVCVSRSESARRPQFVFPHWEGLYLKTSQNKTETWNYKLTSRRVLAFCDPRPAISGGERVGSLSLCSPVYLLLTTEEAHKYKHSLIGLPQCRIDFIVDYPKKNCAASITVYSCMCYYSMLLSILFCIYSFKHIREYVCLSIHLYTLLY
jgi:hypothetical protein